PDIGAPLLSNEALQNNTNTSSKRVDSHVEPEETILNKWNYNWKGLWIMFTILLPATWMKGWANANDGHFDFKSATKQALGGGLSGAVAMVLQVLLLMPIRTTINYQYRHGSPLAVAIATLNQDGGLGRFYPGIGYPTGSKGPIARFGDTAANAGDLALLQSNGYSKHLPSLIQTVFSSCCAATLRMVLTPVDPLKTMLQAQGPRGWTLLQQRIQTDGIKGLWWGAKGTAAATFLGHYPWFVVYIFLSESKPKSSRQSVG
ncbi:hypothetical protein BKA66DRAFT_592623, partial [Pyrenochaeta sp. MPI-SDFR-AT-0127]